MLAAAHDPAIAAKAGIPQKVAREYVLADKLKRETRGGNMVAPVGNRFWEVRSSHGRSPIFESPDALWSACCE